jgi:exonuclease III
MTTPQQLRGLSWNVWGGRKYSTMAHFLNLNSSNYDFICLQEIYDAPTENDTILTKGSRADLLGALERDILPNHAAYFCRYINNIHTTDERVTFPLSFGTVIFVRRNFSVVRSGSVLINGHPTNFQSGGAGTVPRYLQHLTLDVGDGKLLTVANYHGLYKPNNPDGTTNKGDTPDRIVQSIRLHEELDLLPGTKVLCGDLNLRPDTDSHRILSTGLRCLVTEYGITNTRSIVFYSKGERYADNILVTPDLRVTDFEVIEAHEASDHLPLSVSLEI